MAEEISAAATSAHIDDDTLELYAMNRLPEADTAPVEEHLLVCHLCQDRLAVIDKFLAAFEAALGRVQ